MNRSELLDNLAMELGEWPLREGLPPINTEGAWCCHGQWVCSPIKTKEPGITESDWLKRRAELINCPPDSEAPSWAKWKAQDADGWWCWFAGKPRIAGIDWHYDEQPHKAKACITGQTPSGHHWQDTLTEINHMTTTAHEDQYTCSPEDDEEFTRIQARIDTERPHEADARMLDAQIAADISAINPSHYRAGNVECIEALASATINKRGIESVCTANIIKYLWRYEQKNGATDVRKAQWYLNRLIAELEK